MSVYDGIFPLGFGTNRFSVKGPDDEAGLESAAELLREALEAGVSYVDVAPIYSRSLAEEICRRAFSRTDAPRYVTVKSRSTVDQTADDALRRIETAFARMGVDHAAYFVCWSVMSYAEFQELMKKGGQYDGALRAKEQGLIDHICFSTHAPPWDIEKILASGAFEGVTLSYSAVNGPAMQRVLDRAAQNDVGVVVMNPLGGGLIPQNGDEFAFLRGTADETPVQAALRYVYAHPAVKIVLSGMSTREQLVENCAAFRKTDGEDAASRRARVEAHLRTLGDFCTGCRYCDGCPEGIRIFELMQAYNATLLPHPKQRYGRTEPELLGDIEICARLKNTFGFLPPDTANPCVACGRCEEKCTARLPIVERMRELYRRFDRRCFSKASMLERLRGLVGEKRRLAFYPGGGYTAYVLELLREAYPGVEFELSAFDTNSAVWGNRVAGVPVRDPAELPVVAPELVIVSNYNYGDEIYQSLRERFGDTLPVAKLHTEQDVPWVF